MSFYTSSFKPRPKLFVFSILALLGIIAICLFTARAYFIGTGDLISETEAVRIQHSTENLCLYGTTAANNNPAYKLAIYRKIKPEITIMGSSRVLQYASEMFNRKFANLGRTMNHLAEGPAMLERMLAVKKPEMIILGVDFWLLNPKRRLRTGQAKHLNVISPADPSMLRVLIEAVLNQPELISASSWGMKPASCDLGVKTRFYKSGFRADGYRIYAPWSVVDGTELHDYQFRNTLSRIKKQRKHFERAKEPDLEKLDLLIDFIDKIKAAGIKIVVMFPPVAPTISRAMSKPGQYDYIGRAAEILKKRGIEVFNLHDAEFLQTSDCEFMDGFHPGAVVSARMLEYMARTDKRLARVLNYNEINRLLKLEGLATPYSAAMVNKNEPDFLGIGCKKPKLR